MGNTSKQLESVFQEVTDYFADFSEITVTPDEGTPPEHYRITYQVEGVCKEEDGEVYSCNQHVISISLPFGFPHFPPNCRPETPTFHPDFDSSAICIGEAWQADQSITKLILHIGHMISGEIYSLTNAFNEEAAEWYQDHSERLPFSKPALATSPPPEKVEEIDLEVPEIDILDDDDFNQPFALEEEEHPVEESAPPLPATIDIERLHNMAEQKQFHALSGELQATDTHFNGREELEHQVQETLNKATALYREGDELEHRGEHQSALEKYQTVAELVSDYPLLHEAEERVQQSLELLSDWVPGDKETEEEPTALPESPEQQQAEEEPQVEQAPSSLSSANGERTFYEEKKSGGNRWPLYVIGGGSIALLTTLALTYFTLGSGLKEAQQKTTECRSLLDADNFSGAERKCEEALDLISSVQLIKQDEKKALIREIKALLNSERLRQGLAGNILLDGHFVSESTKTLILTFREAKNNGDIFFQQQLWQEAIPHYEKALEAAAKTTVIDKDLTTEIHKQLARARLNTIMLAGEKSLSTSDWDEAARHFSSALQLAKADANIPLEDIVQLEQLSNQAEFNSLRDKGHAFYNNNDWLAALNSYEDALKMVKKLKLRESDTISSLQENIARTKIYMTVEKGQEAFGAAHWDDAITQYEQAIILLEENSKLLSRINTRDSREKLSRIMLHASIIRDKQDAAKHLKSEKYDSALAKLQNIKDSISGSPFADQSEFQTILQEISTQITTAERQQLIVDKTAYLVNNFKKLFLRHYPAASHSILTSPKVEYLKEIGGNLLFRMQCTEESGGRPIRLQMNYLYSPAIDQWKFSSDEE